MKCAAVASLALASIAAAQTTQSKPFTLVVSSSDKSVNGKALSACHSGAGIETLCVYGSGSNYTFNTTQGETAPITGYTPTGTLAFYLPARKIFAFSSSLYAVQTTDRCYFAEPDGVSEPMDFDVDPSTNVANTVFEPGYDNQPVAFDNTSGNMVVISYLDDTKTPPTDGTARVLDKWYTCQTEFGGYQYDTLNWLLGDGTPQNPSCVKVEVTRKFT
jgi:hypothetical protein